MLFNEVLEKVWNGLREPETDSNAPCLSGGREVELVVHVEAGRACGGGGGARAALAVAVHRVVALGGGGAAEGAGRDQGAAGAQERQLQARLARAHGGAAAEAAEAQVRRG